MGLMRETETPATETPGPRPGSRPRVSETLDRISETLTRDAETPSLDRVVPGPESRVSAQATTETRPETPAHPARPVKVHRHVVRHHSPGSRPGTRPVRDSKAVAVASLPRSVRWAAGWGLGLLTIIAAVLASAGQVMFAEKVNAVGVIGAFGFDLTPWLTPAVFDLSVAVLFAGGLYAAARGRSPWPYWIAGFAIGGFSIFTNTQHTGGTVFGGASAVLMVIWFLNLYGRYVDLMIAGNRRSTARSRMPLWLAAPRTWLRAEIIAARKAKPVAASVRKMIAAGEDTSERDLAIVMADRWLIIRDDRLAVELKPVRFYQLRARRAASRKARLTAWREIDRRLGLPVVSLNAIELSEVNYTAAPSPAPVADPVADPAIRPAATTAPSDASDLTTRTAQPRTRPAAAPTSPAPGGKPAINLDDVPGLPQITDPDLRTRVTKDLHHIITIINHDDYQGSWLTRAQKIEKPDITTATGMTGDGVTNRLARLLNELRALHVTSNNPA